MLMWIELYFLSLVGFLKNLGGIKYVFQKMTDEASAK